MPVQRDGPPVATALAQRWERSGAAGLCTAETRVGPAGASVRLSGQLCYASGPGVRRRLFEIHARNPIRRLDLRALTFIDLSGIDALDDVLGRIGEAETPDVHLGARARRLVDLVSGIDLTGPGADPAPRTDSAALRSVAGRGRRRRPAAHARAM
jgi:hypothetical protein